ncbi:MAG: flagellar basal body L-ring protein FlgH [Bacteroidetes bacterium]|nr:flagellar basal body L-ring protein FlgH [Bacteroidota bacterium]
MMRPTTLPINPFLIVTTLLLSLLILLGRPVYGQTLYSDRAPSLYSDPKAHQPGDMITIVLAERTAAQRTSGYDNRSQSGVGGSGSIAGKENLSGTFALNASFNHSTTHRNETVQSDLLQGTITAIVVGVDSTGNLLIKGERKLNVNGVTHLMRVSGMVRPFDIRNNNTILSYQIANALIEYRQDGLVRKFLRPGTFAKIGGLAVLVGALVFGASQ